ncbi:TonB-dependent receptor family protein [Luteimonas sp. e5]
MRVSAFLVTVLLACAAPVPPALARDSDPKAALDRIQVAGHRVPLADFPGAVTVVAGRQLRDGQRQVSLAESLQSVPGVLALERHNHAQDLQLQSRGFGARSTFGIRGLALVVDGIPASALDGQGQASAFALSMLDRIEVLRGPLALPHGNAAGGAIVGESLLTDEDSVRLSAWIGGHGSHRGSLRVDQRVGQVQARAGLSRFRTRGHRAHSAARRDEAHFLARWEPASGHEVRVGLDLLRQPDTDDPLGLTPAQWRQNPNATDAAAIMHDTRKRIDNRQGGLHWRAAHGDGAETRASLWHVRRDIVQFLAIPAAAQLAPSHAGGVIDMDRASTGVSLAHQRALADGAWAVGLEAGRLDEDRRGFENHVDGHPGVRGRLRRDERNRIDVRDLWASVERRFGDDWSMLAAARHGQLRFSSHDRYIAPGNGDDSGRLRYRETAFSAGLLRRLGAHGEAFASLGRGYETPTVTELAYRPDGSGGFNRDLRAARHAGIEAGMRWRGPRLEGSIALFRIEVEDEIVQAASSGGRTSFANAARTRRDGLEAGMHARAHRNLSWRLAANLIDARFRQGWNSQVVRGGQIEGRTIPAGNRIPGIPRASGFAALDWHRADHSLAASLEATTRSAIPVDDRNREMAPGHVRTALALRWRHPDTPGWHAFLRVDNLFDGDHVGSVIVNESNGRSFEPAPGRTFTLGIGLRTGQR